ncbi:hypothetical protein GWI33_008865 [Rhynchophorus ferrugineus]|uniref:Uncharacterized protein n=1 Tax=Rhynchophorus ferrugineus TaxID=354439 RepID=A0A834MDW3_RHYFE|nr:hypothetical protein GWI33_008865 [Rhynchophorus ferrugineus]
MVPVKKCHPKQSFFHDVLVSVNTLQAEQNVGVKICDLVKYMEGKYRLSGDVESQVQSALIRAEDDHFVTQKNNKYSILSPAARIHMASPACLQTEISRIEEIFQIKKKRQSKKKDKCRNRSPSQTRNKNDSCSTCPGRTRSQSQYGLVSPIVQRGITSKPAIKKRENTSASKSFWQSLVQPKDKASNHDKDSCPCSYNRLLNNKKESKRYFCKGRLNSSRSLQKLKNMILNDKKKC